MKRTAWFKLAAISVLVAGCWGDGDSLTTFEGLAVLGDGGTSFSSATMEADLEVLRVGIDTGDGTLRLPVTEAPTAVESTFPYIWVANSGEDTISKIDVRTGAELGVYRTRPDGGASGNPSRTTVDQDGNVWVGNRGSNTVVKVGLKEYGQCVDRNGNGVIDTSTGRDPVPTEEGAIRRSDIRGWTGTSVVTAEDECILQYVTLNAPGVSTPGDIRTVAIDPQNNVFVGGYYQNSLFKINGSTGAIITATNTLQGHYGGVVDKQGNLWSMSSGSGKVQKTSSDLSTQTLIDIGHSGYGIALDNAGRIWTTEYYGRFSVLDPANPAGTLQVFNQTGNSYGQGIAIDDKGDVFIAGSLSSNVVGHYRPTVVGGSVTGVTLIANYTVGSGPTGVAVDGSGKIWATNAYSNNVSRITLPVGTATAVVNTFDVGNNPYNYSDMTGRVVRTVTNRQGTWEATFDGGKAGFDWSGIVWAYQGTLPSGTTVEVQYKVVDAASRNAAKVQFGAVDYTTATSNATLTGVKGRFMKIRIRLTSDSASKTPVVNKLTVR
jgi:streptogramin lyase